MPTVGKNLQLHMKNIAKNVKSIFFYIKDKKHYNFKRKTMKI